MVPISSRWLLGRRGLNCSVSKRFVSDITAGCAVNAYGQYSTLKCGNKSTYISLILACTTSLCSHSIFLEEKSAKLFSWRETKEKQLEQGHHHEMLVAWDDIWKRSGPACVRKSLHDTYSKHANQHLLHYESASRKIFQRLTCMLKTWM